MNPLFLNLHRVFYIVLLLVFLTPDAEAQNYGRNYANPGGSYINPGGSFMNPGRNFGNPGPVEQGNECYDVAMGIVLYVGDAADAVASYVRRNGEY